MVRTRIQRADADIQSPVDGNLLQDPSFEAYSPNPFWSEYSTNYGTPLCTIVDCGTGIGSAGPRTGSVWGWFGGISDSSALAYLYHDVTIPVSCTATLQFYFWIGYAGTNSDSNDYFS